MNTYSTFIIFLLLSCFNSKVEQTFFGYWEVNTPFYKATYQITTEKGTPIGKVISYDDGTTQYQWNDRQPKYIFQNLSYQDQKLVDAVSGATQKVTEPLAIVEPVHKDTLEVIFFINHHPTSERWIRKK